MSAAGRFYRAFYRWNTASNPHRAARRALSSTASAKAQDEVFFRSTPVSRRTAISRDARRSGKRQLPLKGSESAPSRLHVLTNAPIVTSDDKPFDTFQPWEHVVRYRSEAGVLLQFALPQPNFHEAQQRWGRSLEQAQQRSGARWEIGRAVHNAGLHIVPVTISGTYEEVARARDALLGTKAAAWVDQAPQTPSQRPTKTLRPWEKVVRKSDGDYREVEFVMPVDQGDVILQRESPREAEARWNVKVKLHPTLDSEGLDAPFRALPVSISGTATNVFYTYKRFSDLRAATPQAHSRRRSDGRRVQRDSMEQPGETQIGTADSDYTLYLEMPWSPGGQAPDRILMSRRHGIFRKVRHEHDVHIQVLHQKGTLKIFGGDRERVQQAREALQRIIDEDCRSRNVVPLALREITPDTATKQAATRLQTTAPQEASPSERLSGEPTAIRPGSSGETSANVAKISSEDVKLGLSMLTHPVVLITAQVATPLKLSRPEDVFPFCRGMTVSSFSSVTLYPTPVVSFNIRTPSRTWDAIRSTGWLAAHILLASPAGAALADAFTRPYERPDEPFWLVRRMGASVGPGDQNHAAFLTLPDAIACIMHAKVDSKNSTQVGDHMVVVAEVERVHYPASLDGRDGRELVSDAAGLAYAKRGYRALGEQIEVPATPERAAEDSAAPPSALPAAAAEITTQVSEANEDEDDGDAPTVDERVAETPHIPPSSLQASTQQQARERTDRDYFEAFEDIADDTSEAGNDAPVHPATTPEKASSDPLGDEMLKNELLRKTG